MAVTIDGLGDGLSGSLSLFDHGKIERVGTVSARNSIGVFYEQVTNIVGMRELEDEGKVMAMACYSYPFPFEENRLRSFFKVEGTNIVAKYSPLPSRHAQQNIVVDAEGAVLLHGAAAARARPSGVHQQCDRRVRHGNIAMSRRDFSNVKANMQMRIDPGSEELAHLPSHGRRRNGDGRRDAGQLRDQRNFKLQVRRRVPRGRVTATTRQGGARQREGGDVPRSTTGTRAPHAGELVSEGQLSYSGIQGRMEYGPQGAWGTGA